MGTAPTPYTPIPLPDTIDPEGFERLLDDLNNHEGRSTTDDHVMGLPPEQALHILCRRLKPRQITFIVLRYGLNGESPQSYTQIAHAFSVSRQHVVRLRTKLLDKMRHPIY